MSHMRRKVSLGVLLLLIVGLGAAFFRVVAPFLLPLFLAGMTAVICQPLHRYFLTRTQDRVPLAAALTTSTIMAAILIPLLTGTLLATLQLYALATRFVSDTNWLAKLGIPPAVVARTEGYDPSNSDLDTPLYDADSRAEMSDNEADEEASISPAGQLAAALGLTSRRPESETSETTSDEAAPENADQPDTDPITPEIETLLTDAADNADAAAEQESESATDSESAIVATDQKALKGPFVDTVNFVNSWLPRDMQRSPESVAQELRFRVRAMLFELGDRSLGRAAGTTLGIVTAMLGVVVSALVSLTIYIIAVYYFLADGTSLLAAGEKLIPVHAKYQKRLLQQFAVVVRSVVLATFAAAFAQGIATVVALWFFGFPHLFVLLVICTITALIPIAGTWLVWVPCAVILFLNGHWFQAFLLSLYGAAFVGTLDNIVRTYVLNSDTKLHPLLAFISIIGGLQVMGLWGVFIGPIIASCLHALIDIFNNELAELAKELDPNEDVASALISNAASNS